MTLLRGAVDETEGERGEARRRRWALYGRA